MTGHRILIIDDEKAVRDSFFDLFEDFGYRPVTAENGREGLRLVKESPPDLILVDLRMPEVDGLEVLSEVKKISPDMPMIVVSGTGEISDVVEAISRGAWDFVLKPVADLSILLHRVDAALDKARLVRENREHQQNLENIVALRTEELKDANAQLQNVNTRLRDIVDSARRLTSCTDIASFNRELLKEFERHAPFAEGSIYLTVKNGLRRLYNKGPGNDEEFIPFPLEQDSPLKKVMAEGEAFLVNGETSGPAGGPIDDASSGSRMILPLIDEGEKAAGIISLTAQDARVYNRQDKKIGAILASYASESLKAQKAFESLRVSEEKYRLLFEKSPDAIFLVDRVTGKIIDSNQAGEKLIGRDLSELKNARLSNLVTKKTWKRLVELTTLDEPADLDEVEYIGPDGEKAVILLSVSPYLGNLVYGIAHDITARKRAEEALAKSESKYRQLFKHSPSGIFEIDFTTGKFTRFNDIILQYIGYTHDEIKQLSVQDLLTKDSLSNLGQRLLKMQLGEDFSHNPEFKIRTKDGRELWVLLSANYNYSEGSITGAHVVMHDITEQKKAEEALRESEEKYRDLVENMNDVLYILSPDGLITYISPMVKNLSGHDPGEILGRDFTHFFEEKDIPKLRHEMFQNLNGIATTSEYETRNKSGIKICVRTASRPMHKDGKIVGVQGMLTDITERKAAERDLENKAGELAALHNLGQSIGCNLSVESVVEAALEEINRDAAADLSAIYIKEGAGLVLNGFSPNQGPLSPPQVLFWNECRGSISTDGFKPFFSSDEQQIQRILKVGSADNPCKSAAFLPLVSGGEVLGLICIVSTRIDQFAGQASFLGALSNEVALGLKNALLFEKAKKDAVELETRLNLVQQTEREKEILARQLQQSQKMEAIGTLAGGIAHDFNNILTIILGYAQLALKKAQDAGQKKDINRLVSAGMRATELVKQILAFSRQTEIKRTPVSLLPIVKEALKLLRASLPATVEIEQIISKEEHRVLADATEIHQVLMNLCINSYHAMGEQGGTLTVRMEKDFVPACDGNALPNRPAPGEYLLLSVKDDGCGIPPEIKDKIFDPYFTTKDVGQGAGLGLSIVHGIVRRYNGTIYVDSEPGRGTEFKIHLPLFSEPVLPAALDKEPVTGGTEKILFVDDEAEVAELAGEMLEALGYRVVKRTSGLEALECFAGAPDQFDLVITDLTMPKITGLTLAEKIREIRHDIPLIVCSGYNSSITPETLKEQDVDEFLMKPLLIDRLAAGVRKALRRKTS